MSKLLKSIVVVALLAAVGAGCQGNKVVYTPANLRTAVEGRLATSKYVIEAPNFIGSYGRCALVREGELTVFFVGDSLQKRVDFVQNKKTAAFVTRNTTPYVHFIVDFMIANGDTVKVGEAAANLPALRDAGSFQTPDSYVMVAIDQLTPNRRALKAIQHKKFVVIGAKIGTMDTTDVTGIAEQRFTVNLKNVKFIIDDTNEGVQAILRAMKHEDSIFEGGLQYGSIPERSARESHGVGGNVKIGFFKYMDQEVVLRFE